MKILEWVKRVWTVRFGSYKMGAIHFGGKVYEE